MALSSGEMLFHWAGKWKRESQREALRMRSSSGGQRGGERAEYRCGQRPAERPWWRGSPCKGKERALRPCGVAVGGRSRGHAVVSLNVWVGQEAEEKRRREEEAGMGMLLSRIKIQTQC